MKFAELTLDERVMEGLTDVGFTDCTPVQEKTFQYTMEGQDVLVQSQTGTGKTAAFLITIFQRFLSQERGGTSLVVVPTRELAVQIEEEAQLLGSHTGMRIVSVYGGVGYDKQEEGLAGGVDLLIGTPGRLLDFGKSRKIRFREVTSCVIDEADRMFDMGFYPDIRMIMRKLPPLADRQTMLFSATLSTRVRNLAWEYMNSPGEVEISPENVTVELITQELYHVPRVEKFKLLLGILKKENPGNCLIFANTKFMAMELAWRLGENGRICHYIMGDLPQKKRLQVIGKFKSGKIPFLVATDVAARGLHIEDLDMVVNYDIPEDFENYVHRIGRTARAGKQGKAITLACEKYVYGLEAIEEFIKMKIPTVWMDEELLGEDVTAGKPFHSSDEGFLRRSGSGNSGRGRRGVRDRGRILDGDRRRGSGGPGKFRPRRDRERPRDGGERPRIRKSYKARPPASPPPSMKPPRGDGRKLRSDASMEERLNYYQSKYGENFKPVRGGTASPESDSGKPREKSSGALRNSRGSQPGHRQTPRRQGNLDGLPREKRKPPSYSGREEIPPEVPTEIPGRGKKLGFFQRLRRRLGKGD